MRGIGTIRITNPVKTRGAAATPLVPAQAKLPNAFTHEGRSGHLQVSFLTDGSGEIASPQMSVAGAPAGTASGICQPTCITYGNPKKTRCFYQVGCGPTSHPALDKPMAVEFVSKPAGSGARQMDIKLWRHGEKTAAARSSGVLNFSTRSKATPQASKRVKGKPNKGLAKK